MSPQGLILQWNLQSYRTKFSELKSLLRLHAPLCVCLQETLLNPDNPHFPPSQYSIQCNTRTRHDGHERGVAVLIHKRISYRHIPLNTSLQAVAVVLHLERPYTVCSLYLPHVAVTYASLEQLIQQLPEPFLLLGDMNAHSPLWGPRDSQTDARGQLFTTLLHNYPISLLNDCSPTHYHIQTGSLSTVDLSICSSTVVDSFDYEVASSLHDSDHYPIVIRWRHPPVSVERPPRFCNDKANWSRFHHLTELGIDTLPQAIPDLLTTITTVLIDAAHHCMPCTSHNYSKPPVPWWNDACKTARLQRVRAERALRRHHTLEHRIAYNRARSHMRYIINCARRDSWHTFISSINQDLSLHQVWERVQRINGKFAPTPLPVLRAADGSLLSDHADVATAFAEHFSRVSSDIHYTPQFLRHKNICEQRHINFATQELLSYNDPISPLELSTALASTKQSSPGSDGVTYSMIIHAHPTLRTALLCLYNKIFLEQHFPLDWNTALVLPILKPRKEPSHCVNYRPICLTSCLCKLLEKVINSRLIWFLEVNNLISLSQSGFRRNRSTTDHLVHLEQDLRQAMAANQHTIAVFFDIQKAYDTAWRYRVVETLHQFGLRGPLPIFIANFLSNRSIQVRVGQTISAQVPVAQGIPQGSVLSCTCFLVALNDLASAVPPHVQSLLYVDDFTIYISGKSLNHLERQLQLALNSILRWTTMSGFQFSQEKTVSMHICRRRHCPKLAPNLSLDGHPIRCVDSHKFLGLTLDHSLTWKHHITALKTSCHKVLDLFKKLSHSSWGSDSLTLLRLYKMLLKPKLEYGLEAYSSAAPTYLHSLDTIQSAALRFATGAFRSSPISSLHAETSIPLPTYARQQKLLNYYLRLHVNYTHPLHNRILDVDDILDPDIEQDIPANSFLGQVFDLHIQYNLPLAFLLGEPTPQQPPWRASNVVMCTELSQYNKHDVPPHVLQHIFLDHFNTHRDAHVLFTDGSSTELGVGYAVITGGEPIQVRLPPQASIYTAELMAIRDAVTYADSHANAASVTIVSDSRSALQAISSLSTTHPVVNTIRDLLILSDKRYFLCWVPSHVGVPGNEQADQLARTAIDVLPVSHFSLPRSDIKFFIKRSIKASWQMEWSNLERNKLKEILPVLSSQYTNPHPRSWSVKLTRLRIGHTRLTHGYLMNQDPPPYCLDCIVPLTVKHILLECPSYGQHRHLFGFPGPPNLYELFHSTNCSINGPLHTYLHRIGIYGDI